MMIAGIIVVFTAGAFVGYQFGKGRQKAALSDAKDTAKDLRDAV